MLRIERGAVKPGDLFLPFTAGMQIRDVIEGVTYVADAARECRRPGQARSGVETWVARRAGGSTPPPLLPEAEMPFRWPAGFRPKIKEAGCREKGAGREERPAKDGLRDGPEGRCGRPRR